MKDDIERPTTMNFSRGNRKKEGRKLCTNFLKKKRRAKRKKKQQSCRRPQDCGLEGLILKTVFTYYVISEQHNKVNLFKGFQSLVGVGWAGGGVLSTRRIKSDSLRAHTPH